MDTQDKLEVERMIRESKTPGCLSIIGGFVLMFVVWLILTPLVPTVIDFWAKATGWGWLLPGG